MLELHRDLGLVDEHLDEVRVGRDGRKDALHGHDPLEAFFAGLECLEDFGHSSDADAFDEFVWTDTGHGR